MSFDATRRTVIAAAGEPVYHVDSDAAYRRISARRVGNGLFVLDRPTQGVVIDDVRIDDAYRVIENRGVARAMAGCIDLRVSNVAATNLRRGFARIRYDSRGGVLRDIAASGILTTGKRDLPCGVALDDEASDFRFERCTMRGFRWRRKDKQYWNGDGFSTERGNARLLFRKCAAWDNSDGGFDLKSSDTMLDDCIAGGNARNYRLWSSIRATRLTSIEPTKIGGIGDTVHLALMAGQAPGVAPIVIRIEHLVVKSRHAWPIFDVHDGPVEIIVGTHDIDVPPGTPLIRRRGKGSAPGGVRWNSAPPRL